MLFGDEKVNYCTSGKLMCTDGKRRDEFDDLYLDVQIHYFDDLVNGNLPVKSKYHLNHGDDEGDGGGDDYKFVEPEKEVKMAWEQ